jgi:hypothetical protein
MLLDAARSRLEFVTTFELVGVSRGIRPGLREFRKDPEKGAQANYPQNGGKEDCTQIEEANSACTKDEPNKVSTNNVPKVVEHIGPRKGYAPSCGTRKGQTCHCSRFHGFVAVGPSVMSGRPAPTKLTPREGCAIVNLFMNGLVIDNGGWFGIRSGWGGFPGGMFVRVRVASSRLM